MRTRVLVLGAVIALGAISPASALAAGWTPPIDFSLPANASAQTARVTYQSGGTATVAYLELVSQSPLQTVLHAGIIQPGGTYQEQLRMPSTNTAVPAGLALAEAPNGAAVLEWTSLQSPAAGAPLTYFASYRPAGQSSWETPSTIATDTTTESGVSPSIVPAISVDGTAAAGVDHVDPSIPAPGGYRIDVSVHPPGGAWGAAQQISPPSDSSENLGLGFDSSGDLTAAFRVRMPGSSRYTLEAVDRPESNGIWGTLRDITGSDSTSDVYVPKLGVGPDGSAVIAFQYVHYTPPERFDVNAVTRVGENGPWSAPMDVAPGGASSAPLSAGVSSFNGAYILYSFQGTNSGLDCLGAVHATGSPLTFTPPQCVSPPNFQNGQGGVAFANGDAQFAWTGQPNGGSSFLAEGSRWPSWANQPDTATDLDSPAANLTFNSIVDEGDGNAVAFWVRNNVLRAAAFQPSGPLSVYYATESARRWRESRKRIKGHKHKRHQNVGTIFSFGLNMGATVNLTFDHILPGREVSGRCRRPTKHNRHRPWCSRSLPVGSLSMIGFGGSVHFKGRLGRKRLAPGDYTVTFTAVNSWDQQAVKTLKFTIVAR